MSTKNLTTHQAKQYLKALFSETDTVCLTFISGTKKYASGGAVTENVFLPMVQVITDAGIARLTERNQDWHIYVSMAPFKPGSKNRTKANIAKVSHVFIEADENGDAVLTSVRAAVVEGDIPAPTIIVQSSPHRYQFVWNVTGFTIPLQEALNRTLQQKFGTDAQAVDAARVLRVAGFHNIKPKYGDPKPVAEIVEYNEPPFMGITIHDFNIPLTSEPDDAVHPVASNAAVQQSIEFLEAAMEAASVSYTRKSWDGSGGAYKFPLALCPWRESHENGGQSDAIAIVQPSGAYDFKCLHNHCSDKRWNEFRAHLESLAERKLPFTPNGKPKSLGAASIAFAESGNSPPPNRSAEIPRIEIDDEKQASPATPTYPSDTIDGDLIGELTRALTDGTFIPPQFMRENIKVALGLIIDGFVGFPNHEDLHTREYLHNVSVYPQSGKGESFKRSIAYPTGFLSELLKKFGVSIVDGGLFGSGEFMVKILKDASTHRSIARFDEMSEVWSKNRALGCTLEKKLLTLFESTSAAQGSFKNGVHADSDFHVSVVGDFTKESFDVSFTGSGSRGSGYLSRCIFQFADKQALAGDWQSINIERVRHILSGIEARLTEILNHDGRLIPSEGAEANSLRLDFYAWLDTQDARYIPRLKDHLKRDVLLRAVISSDGAITTEMMRRSIEWCKNQLDNRLALFPEDAGNAVEIMERGILRDITTKGQASERDLKKACNVNRAGSGGHEVFNRALRSLMFGHEIKVVGKTRKGLPVYALFEAV